MKPLEGTSLGQGEEEAQGATQGRRRRQRQRASCRPSPSPGRYVHKNLTQRLPACWRGRDSDGSARQGTLSIVVAWWPLLLQALHSGLPGGEGKAPSRARGKSLGVQIMSQLGAGLQVGLQRALCTAPVSPGTGELPSLVASSIREQGCCRAARPSGTQRRVLGVINPSQRTFRGACHPLGGAVRW